LLCASPERFIHRSGSKLISQPIKGTAKRGSTEQSDELSKNHLATSEKEKAENVMIVDLVRNDLSKFAVKGTVLVDELFGVYTFPRVHQMISTVSCEIKKAVTFTQILRSAFPMGSMTGAPKVSAMNIIEEFENFKRGLFSGTVGYIQPDGDFDFNVVIRSILYDSESRTIAIPAGGAITNKSIPEEEFDEMVLKLRPQLKVLGLDPEKMFY
jgi:para-aminobenzoate synthetase component 1